MESTFKFIPDFTRHITFTENNDQSSAFLYQWMNFINNSWKYKRWQVNLRKPKGWTWDKNHVAQSYFVLFNSASLIKFKVSHSQFYMPIFLTNFFFGCVACGILVPCPGLELTPPAFKEAINCADNNEYLLSLTLCLVCVCSVTSDSETPWV